MNQNKYKGLLAVLILLLTGMATYQAYQLRKDNIAYQSMKEDYAFITKINFGLFNMKEWRGQMLDVFTEQVENFEISSTSYGEVEKELNVYLNKVYRDYIANGKIFNQVFSDAEKNAKVNKIMLALFKDNVGTQIQNLNIPQYIPGMAKLLGKEFQKSEPKIKEILKGEIKTILNSADPYPQADPRESIYAKYGTDNLESAKDYLNTQIATAQKENKSSLRSIYGALLSLTLMAIALFGILGFNLSISLISIISVVFLLLGISLPMIDIDVRMNSFVFSLFNQDISFEEQAVFYQSKSILQVTKTLLSGRGLDLKIVGYMILLFSVVFPFIKLVLSSVYLYSKKLQDNKLVRGLIFHLGKWSMADVFVVALFMAYIGFYGLIESQMAQVERNQGGFGIETVNYSSLAPGALFFATYCVLSIIIGVIINRHHNRAYA